MYRRGRPGFSVDESERGSVVENRWAERGLTKQAERAKQSCHRRQKRAKVSGRSSLRQERLQQDALNRQQRRATKTPAHQLWLHRRVSNRMLFNSQQQTRSVSIQQDAIVTLALARIKITLMIIHNFVSTDKTSLRLAPALLLVNSSNRFPCCLRY